jgi:hypothetical protein
MKPIRLLLAVLASMLLLAGASAQSRTAPADPETTFFGYTMGRMSPRGAPRSDSGSYWVGKIRMWQDKFEVGRDKAPSWLTSPMEVRLQTTQDGVIQEATFELPIYQQPSEAGSLAMRTQRTTELINRVSEKLDAKPDVREQQAWKLRWPFDGRVPPISTEAAYWIRPWGRVYVVNCTLTSYPEYRCLEDGFVPVIHVETNAMRNMKIEALEVQKQQREANDASRLKM